MPPEVPALPDETTVLQRVHSALADLWAHDRLLIERGVGRPSIVHRLAVALERQFPGFHTDVAYSRNSREEPAYNFPHLPRPRQQDLRRRLARQGLSEAAPPAPAETYPDIIVHVRERGDLNVLIAEVCLLDDPRGWGGVLDARERLARYTLPGEEGLFRYGLGLLVELGLTAEGDHTALYAFREGREVGRVG